MAQVHPSAIVAPEARLGDGVEVGPYAVIGPHVVIGDGTRIGPHAVVEGHTTIGRDNRIFQFASIGAPPQDKKYAGEPTRLVVGDRNTFREFVTLNTGTVQDGGVTTVGSDNWIMAYVHVAHDCHVGDQTIIANAVQLGGHVRVGDWAIVGGVTGVHQFSRIGAHAMVGFSSRLAQDLPPFVTAAGNPASAAGVNLEGLRRRGFSAARIAVVKRMYRLLFREGLTQAVAAERIAALADETPEAAAEVRTMLDFLGGASRGLVR